MGLKNKIHAAVKRNLEEILEVKRFLKISIGLDLIAEVLSRAMILLILVCIHFSTTGMDKGK